MLRFYVATQDFRDREASLRRGLTHVQPAPRPSRLRRRLGWQIVQLGRAVGGRRAPVARLA
jgi:hypothetical protein